MTIMSKKQIKQELKNNQALLKCAGEFGLVGDPTRMKICWLLCKHPELSVGKITELLEVSVSAVSHSLRKLRKYNLVKTRREHKQIFYKLSDNEFNLIVKKALKTGV